MHISKRILPLLLSVAVLFLVGTAGCARSAFEEADNGRLKVIASIYPMADFSEKIGGDHVQVIQLIPAGFEPHSWEPSPLDMRTFEDANIFVYNGAGIEMWVDKVMSSIKNNNLIQVNASSDISLIEPGSYSVIDDPQETDHEHDAESDHPSEDLTHGKFDPHVWLDPQNAKIQMKAICEAFCQADPEHEDDYRHNYARYAAEVDVLDNEYREALRSVTNPYIVVSHEAFGYMCKAYGLYQIPIRGISADAEPDAARMREIIDLVNEYEVSVIFFEALSSPKVSAAIADETGCEIMALHPIGGLTEEQMDAGEDYFSMMRYNLEALKSSFSEE
ncbi:MAG: zinc ABC transporter substrate-binding protein [Clostridiales bacterium]|nr:zinc ABC transporter substrate-binding protein [Clostridiales bacterium]